MNRLKNLPFKINISIILFLIFFATSVFLSFKMKIQKEKFAEYYSQQNEQENQMLSYRLFLINETLKANYKLSGTKTPIDNNESFHEVSQEKTMVPVLYLKNMPAPTVT